MIDLEKTLEELDGLAQIAQFFPAASAAAKLSDMLLQVAIKTNQAHMALFGKPLDYSKIPEFVPVPLNPGPQ